MTFRTTASDLEFVKRLGALTYQEHHRPDGFPHIRVHLVVAFAHTFRQHHTALQYQRARGRTARPVECARAVATVFAVVAARLVFLRLRFRRTRLIAALVVLVVPRRVCIGRPRRFLRFRHVRVLSCVYAVCLFRL